MLYIYLYVQPDAKGVEGVKLHDLIWTNYLIPPPWKSSPAFLKNGKLPDLEDVASPCWMNYVSLPWKSVEVVETTILMAKKSKKKRSKSWMMMPTPTYKQWWKLV